MMKKLLLILIALPMIGFGQQTYVPDDNFEAYLEANGMGNGITSDDYVTTANINTVTDLHLNGTIAAESNISDLTGIEGFTNLTEFSCIVNPITSIDLSANSFLTYVAVRQNSLLTSLNVSGCTLLTTLVCDQNQLLSLDVSQNTSLIVLACYYNQLSTLNISLNPALVNFECSYNNLTSLDARNGGNISYSFGAMNNPNLFCIDVDDMAYATANYYVDPQTSFSLNCIVFGCTDFLACNYDLLANVDDGSCIYPVIWQQAFPICNGDSVIVGSSVYNTTGNYIDTLTAVNGCDSIVYTDVTSNFPTIWYQTYLICDGDSVAVGSSVYDAPGNYMDTLISANGCDSIVQTYLMIDENTSLYDTLSVGASIVWNGISLNVSGDYSVTLINSVGCDSIVNLNLTVTTTGILDIANNKNNLVKITDMLGQETPYRKNTPLFYIFDDGTVEKRIVIE